MTDTIDKTLPEKDIKLPPSPKPIRTVVSQMLDPSAFPHPAKPGYAPSTTIENTQHLLDGYGITANYNVISKKTAITLYMKHHCPHCPENIELITRMALGNDLINTDIIECTNYDDLVKRDKVDILPAVIINNGDVLVRENNIVKILDTIESY